jgi:hypothetical protein
MNKPETRLGTRIEVTKDGMRFRPRLVTKHQRKEPETMNYRDYNPNNACLPAEAYPYLALALADHSTPAPTMLDRVRTALRRLAALLPVAFAVATLPPESPLETSLRLQSLVWVQPLPGKKLPQPPTLPRIANASRISL